MAKSVLTREEFAKFIEEQREKLSEFLLPFMQAGITVETRHVSPSQFQSECYITTMRYGDPDAGPEGEAQWQFINNVPLFQKDIEE